MLDLKACRVCFNTSGRLYKIDSGQLRTEYRLVSGLESSAGDGMPQYLCVECSVYVKRFKKFRKKCQIAHFALKELLKKDKQIKISNLKLFDHRQIDTMPTLSYVDLENVHYEEVKFQWVKHNRLSIEENDNIPVFHCSTLTLEHDFQVSNKKSRLSNSFDDALVKSETTDVTTEIDIDCALNGKNESNYEQSSSNAVEDVAELSDDNDDNFISDNEAVDTLDNGDKDKNENEADGTNLNEEYAIMEPISKEEAKAVIEVYKKYTRGKFKCKVCSKAFKNDSRLQIHLRMHDQHISGNFLCDLCHYYYKTDFLLKTHMTEKHLFKYICKKCPEVTFDRTSAKQHYIFQHLQQGKIKDPNWYDCRPNWLNPRGGKRVKGVVALRSMRRSKKLPDDFLIYAPVSQEDQYELVQQRKTTRNYMEAQYKCEFCFRGFREATTYAKHMKKHDPALAGTVQCDMCKLYFLNTRKLYKHLNITHLYKYSCQVCPFVCYNRGQALMHYRWHKNVMYSCPHCKKEFKKVSTRLTHIRIKHPSTYICNLCGHSFVSENGLYCHKKIVHSQEEIEQSASVPINVEGGYYCAECKVQFMTATAFKTHLGSSSKHAETNLSIKPQQMARTGGPKKRGRPKLGGSHIVNNGLSTSTHCDVCGKFLMNDVQARKHYEAEHPGAEYLKRYMCDVCGHTTRQYANLMVHMRTHTNEKPYGCPHCDRCFSMPSNRDRHLVVHTGEKRYQCQHCNRRFTQSSAVKLHIQTVHLKIPYAPWDKKNRKRRKELEGTAAPVSAVTAAATAACIQMAPPKLLLEPQTDYLNAYISYNDE